MGGDTMNLTTEQLAGLRVTIIGAAREGSALTSYLLACGAHVTLCDRKADPALVDRLAELERRGAQLALGVEPGDDLLQVDVLFISPAVPRYAPVVLRARELGVPISSEPRLFSQSCPAPIIGITGSSGKTTTTAMVGEICSYAGLRTWVGGNIGSPLTERLLERPWPDIAVMELSSFQLELYTADYQGPLVEEKRSVTSRAISVSGWSPHVALVTNVTPNHLDRHADMAEYTAAKHNLVACQGAEDWLVLNADDAVTRNWAQSAQGRLLRFSLEVEVAEGAFMRGEQLVSRIDGSEKLICLASEVQLRGRHNLANILAAACCALAAGVDLGAIQHVARTFTGVAHRLEVVCKRQGVLWINDSIATSPERACAALRSFKDPLVLLAGGRDKHLPWDEWARLVLERVRVVIAFGEAVPIIERALSKAIGPHSHRCPELHAVATLEEAVSLAGLVAKQGEVVLLSPGGTSFDAFVDFEERGQRFRSLVAAL
ncbi:MAG: UDP-N-acetylmuramoyl-L-alanine--D-glutamate ligase [Anaerolineae bacterium]